MRRAAKAVVAAASCLAGVGALGLLGPAPTLPGNANAAVVPGHGAASSTAPGTGGAPLMKTPLLSPGRLPLTLQDLWAERNLASSLGKAMSPSALGASAAGSSCAEVAQGGQVLYAHGAGLRVLPASNMKLLTATALLDKLGPGYTFKTTVLAAAGPVSGVVDGNLYLVGGGDPLLRTPSYVSSVQYSGPVYTNVDDLVALLEAAGVRQVTGSVLADESRYDSVRYVASWPASYAEQGDVGPLSAVGINDGTATAPSLVPTGDPPPVQSAGVLTQLLEQAGVGVGGAPGEGSPPAGATVLARLVSPPLKLILGEVLRESDNTAMELMTKELGLKELGSGTTAAGTAAVRADLKADGFPLKGFVNVDGSGLSRVDRVTCGLLLAALERSGPTGVLVRDLPVAGESGTLTDELNGTVAAGRVLAKTGSLNGVKALSGWALPVNGEAPGNPGLSSPVVFSLVLNGLPLSVANPALLTDRVAVDVAEYPQAPALGAFEPG